MVYYFHSETMYEDNLVSTANREAFFKQYQDPLNPYGWKGNVEKDDVERWVNEWELNGFFSYDIWFNLFWFTLLCCALFWCYKHLLKSFFNRQYRYEIINTPGPSLGGHIVALAFLALGLQEALSAVIMGGPLWAAVYVHYGSAIAGKWEEGLFMVWGLFGIPRLFT